MLPSLSSSFLRPGSKFSGTQQSDKQVYDVNVEIKHVDMAESFMCGYLRIQGRFVLTVSTLPTMKY
jgi:glucose-induced degradation protein 4